MTERGAVAPALAVASGVLLSLAFPSWLTPLLSPWTGWLAWVALVPLLMAIGNSTPRQALWRGWLSGAAFWASTLYWIAQIREMEYMAVPALLLFAGALGIFTGIWAWLVRRFPGIPAWVSAPAAWMVLEWMRGWVATGFPWVPLGASQWGFTSFFVSVRYLGIHALSGLVVSVNLALWMALRRREGALAAVSAAVVLAALLSALSWSGTRAAVRDAADRTPFRAALLQGSFTEQEKWAFPLDFMLMRFERMGDRVKDQKPSLMLWPETATASELNGDPLTQARLARMAARTGAAQVVGVIQKDPFGRLSNSAVLVTSRGVVAAYGKRHLVPFGEYIPGWVRAILPFARKLTEGVLDYAPGTPVPPMEIPGAGRAGLGICYEAIFPGIYRAQVRRGAEFLLNLTNDAWYWHSAATGQHALGSILTAVSTGRYFARCANTGLSLLATPSGRVETRLGLFEAGVHVVEMVPLATQTGWVRWGDWPALAAALLAWAVFGLRRRGQGREPK